MSVNRPRAGPTARLLTRRCGHAVTAACLTAAAVFSAPDSAADPPSNDQLIRPLPIIVPRPTNWQPKFPFPYDQTRSRVTDADIQAEREMCQWFTAQYQTVNDQIGRLQFNRIQPDGTDGNYNVDGLQRQVDIVVGNINQSLEFLTPRVQALTQSQDFAGDVYFPIYKGDAFYGLWQQLSNVRDGINAHQPDWFTGPSYLRAKKWASEITRSHVCD
ncbi:hypothetical protein [Mycobacterium sp. Marseille-P9652]|uniref:hypothetical protein n=1 Tax=Mycobacterium sp. Marseille-P9652 TaxID=2654950 RepID=UPI001E5C00FF|nr:hypothetical protein [Mycobacterium sp. Marseille-P9652]